MSALRQLELRRAIAGGLDARRRHLAEVATIDEDLAARQPDLDAARAAKERAESAYVALKHADYRPTDYGKMGHPGFEHGEEHPDTIGPKAALDAAVARLADLEQIDKVLHERRQAQTEFLAAGAAQLGEWQRELDRLTAPVAVAP